MKKLKYKFKNENLLINALTHSSYSNEKKKLKSNERLEFLGDSILGFICAEYLYKNFNFNEGDFSRIRSSVVCEQSLCKFARALDMGEYLLLGKGEASSGGRNRDSILADAFESLTAAIYLDGGMKEAEKFVLEFLVPAINDVIKQSTTDYKTFLQEIVQKNPQEKLSYEIISETGPAHDKKFVAIVKINSNIIGEGEGKNKKDAEQQAAKVALELMGQ